MIHRIGLHGNCRKLLLFHYLPLATKGAREDERRYILPEFVAAWICILLATGNSDTMPLEGAQETHSPPSSSPPPNSTVRHSDYRKALHFYGHIAFSSMLSFFQLLSTLSSTLLMPLSTPRNNGIATNHLQS